MSGTASWLNAEDMIVLGWTIDGVWQGVIGDRPRVVALVARDPESSVRRLVYFDPAFRKLTTAPHPETP